MSRLNLKLVLRLKERQRPNKKRKRDLLDRVNEALANGLLRGVTSDSNGVSSFTISLMLSQPGQPRCKGCHKPMTFKMADEVEEFGGFCDRCLSKGRNFD